MSDLFRKKSLERISSPEQLNAYIRVSTPSVWLVLSAVVMLLAGVCVWGIFGCMETTVSAVAVAREGSVTAYIPAAECGDIVPGAVVYIGDSLGSVLSVSSEPVCVDDSFTGYMLHVGALQTGQWVYAVMIDVNCSEGVHEARIVIDSVSPMSFVLN